MHLDHSDSVGACQPTGNDGGISPETEAQIDDIQDKINNPNFGLFEIKAEIIELLNAVEAIQITTDNHYVPFTALTTTRVTCDLVDGGSAPSVGQVRIRGSATTGNYIVTGVYMSPDGLNGVSDTDFIKLRALSVDGATVGFSISDNLVGNTNGSSSFDLMGQPLKDGGTFPHQIEVVNNVLIEITCNAGTTGSGLGFLANSIKISGWKQVDDEIVVDFLGEI